ncbi:MAG: hypothetical protein KAG97_00805, partial [Victivallales bacterium]|nr:hypothetical protein [Victivallales bacterium]
MIVKMLKITLLCLKNERELALERLRDIGAMHIDSAPIADTDDRSESSAKLAVLEKAMLVAESIKGVVASEVDSEMSPDALAESLISLSDEKNKELKKEEELHSNRDLIAPWGDFSPRTLEDIREKGVFVHLCNMPRERFEEFKSEIETIATEKAESVSFHTVQESKHDIHFAIIANFEIDTVELPLARLPENASLAEILAETKSVQSRISEIDAELAEKATFKDNLKKHSAELADQLEFLENRDTMAESGVVAHISGFIPAEKTDELNAAAKDFGWGFMITEPGPDDNTPTYIKVPKMLEVSKPIFEFIGISPGYNEWDVSTCFLVFFTIFVGILVGDAGYGLLFLTTALFAKFMIKGDEKTNQMFNLFILLSLSTVIWGALNGTYFAINAKHLPSWMHGIDWLTDPATKNAHVQQLCFIIAGVHLSFAHLWKAILFINSRKALGEVGWAMLIWGNFLTALNLVVYPGNEWPITLMLVLYVGGLFLTAVFAINWKEIGDICNYPFNLIGTFVDLLSYIRLFAVGLATFYVADSFNNMGVMLMKSSDNMWAVPFLIIFAVIVILAGHGLNIILAGLAILVHGIRL